MALYSRSETDEQSVILLNTTVKDSVDKYTSDNGKVYDGDSTVSGAEGYDTAARRVVYIDDVEATLEENRNRGLTAPGWWEYMTYTDGAGNTRHKAQHLVSFKDAPDNTVADADDSTAADSVVTLSLSTVANQNTKEPAGGILTVDTIGAPDILRVADTYTIGASDYTTDASGTGATFTVVVNGSGAATVTIEDAGSGFVVDETITISDADLGGGGAANLTFDVATVATAAATFSVVATGSGTKSYQWQRQTATGTTWSNIVGATSSSLALTNLSVSDNGKKFRVKVTSSVGANEAISNTATLTVTAA